MNKKIVSSIIFMTLMLAACAPLVATPAVPAPAVTEEIPVTSHAAVIQSVEIEILESQPLQVNAIIRGQLPDAGCTTIKSVEQIRNGNTIKLTMVTTTDPLALCAPALTPFEQVTPLNVKDLPAGTYIVNVNGVEQPFQVIADLMQFKQDLVEALNARDYNVLKAMMDESLIIASYRSQGSAYDVDAAIDQLKLNYLSGTSPITDNPNQDLGTLLSGIDPLSIFGLDVGPNQALFLSGLGLDGKDEAILYVNYRLDGSLYWHGILVAKGGFAELNPVTVQNPPTPLPRNDQPTVYEQVFPTFSIVEVVEDGTVTIETKDFPANTKFFVRMGKMGTKGIDGILVDTINSKRGGTFTVTFNIPRKLHGEKKIAIRLESNNGYFSYNWFDNEDLDIALDHQPTSAKYVIALDVIVIREGPGSQYGAIGSLDEGQKVKVTGISADGNWWRIKCPDKDFSSCWVSAKPENTQETKPPK
jgi:hypothetical protein